MNTNSHRFSALSAHGRLLVACLTLSPVVAAGCGDAAEGNPVSADYSPESDFSLTHPSGAEVTIPAGARTSGLKITASVPPPSRRPAAAYVAVGDGISISPQQPQLTMPATITLPITPTLLPAGTTIADVTIVQDTDIALVPLPTRRGAAAVVAESYTFGRFFPVVRIPSDGGVVITDAGVDAAAVDAAVEDAAVADTGVNDVGISDAGADARVFHDGGGYCGDGIVQPGTYESCDEGDANIDNCTGPTGCHRDCYHCLE